MDFYVLATTKIQARDVFICRLTQKAFQQGHRILLRLEAEDLARIDELLWSFQSTAFIPHGCSPDDPVVLQSPQAPRSEGRHDVWINLCPAPLASASGCQRLCEILWQAPEILEAGRQRFRSYRERGWQPQRLEIPELT